MFTYREMVETLNLHYFILEQNMRAEYTGVKLCQKCLKEGKAVSKPCMKHDKPDEQIDGKSKAAGKD